MIYIYIYIYVYIVYTNPHTRSLQGKGSARQAVWELPFTQELLYSNTNEAEAEVEVRRNCRDGFVNFYMAEGVGEIVGFISIYISLSLYIYIYIYIS